MRLMELVIALGIGSVVVFGVNRLMTQSARFAKHQDEKQVLLNLRGQILERLNCERTFGFSTPPDFALACQNFQNDLDLKDSKGESLNQKFGLKDWSFYGRCEGQGITVKLKRKGNASQKDPVTQKDWNDVSTRGHALRDDLFAGSSQLCMQLFDSKLGFKEPAIAGIYQVNTYDCGSESDYLHPCNRQHIDEQCLLEYPILQPDDFNAGARQACSIQRYSSCKAKTGCCRHPNPLTKDCSCPKGTAVQGAIYEFNNPGCSNGYYADSWRQWGCGIQAFACYVYQK